MPDPNALSTSYTCPECGAVHPDGATCEDVFNALLALEFSDPGGAGIVHHLTVPCYMLQHDRYSDEGAVWAIGLLEATLERGISPDAYRAQTRATVDQARRDWKITRPADAPPRPRLAWPLTLADARPAPPAVPGDDPAGHPARIERWARSVLATIRAAGGYPPLPGR